ncbi:hypothetical protein ACD591_18305 [Rufibacter glacialis]|uniref:Uncharacterized protein n=1 Tax=Rufibacter glacialis TaxID=1259555 RepID=A0A5M8Q7F0_9BACT|nr:hypothetical protein [Rufibacter glacialis]KAA6430796.1 hypothetical protein FOE74_20225 [Rufibacter glacialis]
MNTPVKKMVAGKPIEKLLKNSSLLPVDKGTINDSLTRLQDLRLQYMQAPTAGKSVFKLPPLKK